MLRLSRKQRSKTRSYWINNVYHHRVYLAAVLYIIWSSSGCLKILQKMEFKDFLFMLVNKSSFKVLDLWDF